MIRFIIRAYRRGCALGKARAEADATRMEQGKPAGRP